MKINNIYVLLIFLLFVVINFFLHLTSNKCESNIGYMKSKHFEGVIEVKELNRKDWSGSEMIKLKNNYEYAWEEDVYRLEGKELYPLLDIGDYVLKNEGSTTLQIIKPDITIKFDLSWQCD